MLDITGSAFYLFGSLLLLDTVWVCNYSGILFLIGSLLFLYASRENFYATISYVLFTIGSIILIYTSFTKTYNEVFCYTGTVFYFAGSVILLFIEGRTHVVFFIGYTFFIAGSILFIPVLNSAFAGGVLFFFGSLILFLFSLQNIKSSITIIEIITTVASVLVILGTTVLHNLIFYDDNVSTSINYVAHVAMITHVASIIPQVAYTVELKSAVDFNGVSLTFWFLGSLFWLIYFSFLESFTLVLTNGFGGLVAIFLLYYKFWYKPVTLLQELELKDLELYKLKQKEQLKLLDDLRKLEDLKKLEDPDDQNETARKKAAASKYFQFKFDPQHL